MDDSRSLKVRWTQGFTNQTVEFVDNRTVCYVCGNNICFLNLETKGQSVLQGPGRGVGALTANGNTGVFAFSEQKLSPSIFVYIFPELLLKNELKGGAQLDYTSLALSDGGPYLGCCSSLPDHIITVWNWETAEPICSQPQAGKDVVSLAFNPMNWLQLCALCKTSVTVWNIEKSASFHVLKPCVIELPTTDGSVAEKHTSTSYTVGDQLSYFGPEMPPSAIAGLKGIEAESIAAELFTKARLTPTAICWTATSELCVGCEQGFLLLVDPESLSVSVIVNPTTPDAISDQRDSSFRGLTLNKNGLIAVGKGCSVHCLQIKGTHIDVTQTWTLEGPATHATHSPDHETLLLSSDTGQIYVLNSTRSDKVVKVLDVLSGNFVAAVFLPTDENISVSARDSGELQLWSADGVCLGSLSLHAEVTSLACCPIARYAAVGTSSGSVLFVDLNREQKPRLVHQTQLYHCPVDHLVFDQEGHYLLTGASDSHVYVIDAKPSKQFSVIGHAVAPGAVLSLSTRCIRDREQVKVLALCGGPEFKNQGGRLLTLLSLSAKDLTGPDCADRHGCLSSHVLRVSRYEVPRPLQSCVLGVSEVFGYCHEKKSLQRFQLPEDTDGLTGQQHVVQLNPQQEVRAHPLGPACLALSPHHLWLASVGRDGLLRIRATASLELYAELQCHSCRLGGVRSVMFSVDGLTLLTAGFRDGSVMCTELRMKGVDAQVITAAQHSQSLGLYLKTRFTAENPVLIDLPVWKQGRCAVTGTSERSEGSGGADSLDVTEPYESFHSPALAPPSHPTWLEGRREAVMKEENEKHSEMKENLRRTVSELRRSIQELMRENENLPAIERLPQQEFNLDAEEQKRLEVMVEQEVKRVRKEIEREILAKCYLRDVLKRECWDSMKVKGRAIKGFHSKHEVKNYALRERTESEVEELHRVQNTRRIEMAASSCGLKKSFNMHSPKEDEQGEDEHTAERAAAVTGSFSAELGYSNPYIYDQFSLQTTGQMISQIILLQDVIYRIKTSFNAEFEAVQRQKLQELNRVKDRNRLIGDIMQKLDMDNEQLWEPSLSCSEWPERLLTVDDSEIKAEKFLTAEQKREEERKKLEEQRRLAAKGDNSRERALHDMMEGMLEVKEEDILKMEIPPPEFVLTRDEDQWSEEEKKVYKLYEKKTKALSEEKDKYKKLLETEMKKLQASNREATERFDETLTKLYKKKFKCEMAIYQEELRITYLLYSVLTEEEMRNRELELKLKLERTLAYKDETGEEVRRHEEEVELFHEAYDVVVAEDKVLDKDFRKDFLDVPAHVVDHLYKLFKRRPRLQKLRTQTDSKPNVLKEQRLCGSLAPDALGKMLKAVEELDAPENTPEGLNTSVWERFCLVRRAKIESEQKVKEKALTFAEMQAFLQKRRDENKAAEEEIKNLSDELESLHKEKNRFMMDVMVQVVLKQGQVSTKTASDFTDAVLLHMSVVGDLNRTIRTLAEQKITSMVECKDFSKGTIQLGWEKEVMRMQIEDLNNKARDIRMLHLSEAQQDYLNKIDRDSRASKQISILEKTIAFQEKTHLHNVQQRVKKIEQFNRQAAKKESENMSLEQELLNMQVSGAEMRNIHEAIASQENRAATTEERFREIVQKKNLEDLARAQAEDLVLLWAEVERLRRKNFPSLDQLKHN
ncbi:cilia- and flagella-associated protein 43 isoform X2 [Solea solea]|uniref:cilia- and flagella-associated protein 43 isoform X2 n=1 Tax=Solea solea TaxID=90069 RepID=UPI00272AC80D|nr:cilia- and flagella-associated protein 43 isoform X2 [Solea solea]